LSPEINWTCLAQFSPAIHTNFKRVRPYSPANERELYNSFLIKKKKEGGLHVKLNFEQINKVDKHRSSLHVHTTVQGFSKENSPPTLGVA